MIDLVRFDKPAATRHQRQSVLVQLHVGNSVVYAAETRGLTHQRVEQQETEPRTTRPRIRSKEYVAGPERLMADPDQRSSDWALGHFMAKSAKQRHRCAIPFPETGLLA